MPGAVGKPCSSVVVVAVHKALLFTLTSVLFQSDPEMSWACSVPLEPVPCFQAAVSPGFCSQLVQSVFFQVLQCLGSLAFWLSAPLVPCQPLCCTWHAWGLSPVTRMWGGMAFTWTAAYKSLFLIFLYPQRTSLGRHWCTLRWGRACWGWRGFCSSSREEEERSASTTATARRPWAWPWRGATRSCTSFWPSKDDFMVPLLVFPYRASLYPWRVSNWGILVVGGWLD